MSLFKQHQPASKATMKGSSEDDGRNHRLGGAAVGLLIGLLMGLVGASTTLAVFKDSPSFALWVFGGGVIGVPVGALFPSAMLNALEVVAHFVIGFFNGAYFAFAQWPTVLEQSRHAPLWLKVIFWLGLAVGLVLLLLSWS